MGKSNLKDDINEALLCMLASEDVLSKAWNTPEDDEAWKNL